MREKGSMFEEGTFLNAAQAARAYFRTLLTISEALNTYVSSSHGPRLYRFEIFKALANFSKERRHSSRSFHISLTGGFI